MSVAKITRDFVESMPYGKLFTYDDVPSKAKSSVAIELSRLFKKGVVKKVSKGKYYKPKIQPFGEVEPSSNEKISSYLDSAKGASYETGFNSFRKLGLTTQVAKTTTIATNKPYRKVQVDNVILKFIPKRVDVAEEDISLVQILDALKDINKIPATTPSKALEYLKEIIKSENIENQKKLAQYSMDYTPRTRALLGAILKDIGNREDAYELKQTLNPLTKYKLGIDDSVFSNKTYWNIV
jgi:predicted transcriptional regulator of viral defense system